MARVLGAPSGKPEDLEKLIYRRTPHNAFAASHPPQGEYGYATYPEAAPRPFKEQGYRTVFLYGGSTSGARSAVS